MLFKATFKHSQRFVGANTTAIDVHLKQAEYEAQDNPDAQLKADSLAWAFRVLGEPVTVDSVIPF